MQISKTVGAAGPRTGAPSDASLVDVHEQRRLRLEVCLAEYARLKSEQTQRIVLRDNLVYATLVTIAGVVAFSFQKEEYLIGLLVLPFACFVLGWLHTINDEKSASIGRYLRTTLRPYISELTGDCHPCTFGWENAVRTSKHRTYRKVVQLISNWVAFVAPGVAAFYIYSSREGFDFLRGSWPLTVAWALGGVLLGILAVAIVLEADIGFVGRLQRGWRKSRRGSRPPLPVRAARVR